MVKPLLSLAFGWISLFLITEVGQCLLTSLLTCRKTYGFREACNINAPITQWGPSLQPHPTISIGLCFASVLEPSSINIIVCSMLVDKVLKPLQDCL